jgi:[protein-PII] uridylyltransferase
VATRRDIDDPKTISEFCDLVHGREGLRELYLLTVADVSTTSPTSMTAWKARMLDDLYVAVDRSLVEGGVNWRTEQALAIAQSVRKTAKRDKIPAEFCDQFLKTMPERYLFANPVERIASHLQFAYASESQAAKVQVLSVREPYVELAVSAADAPGLLAKICATFSVARIKVVSAQVYSWAHADGQKRVLDIFWVRSGVDSSLVVAAATRVQVELLRLINGEVKAEDLVASRGQEMRWSQRAAPRVETRINFDARSATSHTILEVITRDRRDSLYRLSNAISSSGLTIDLAKINTEGDRVADVFYVSMPEGGKVTDQARLDELYNRLVSTMAEIEETEE